MLTVELSGLYVVANRYSSLRSNHAQMKTNPLGSRHFNAMFAIVNITGGERGEYYGELSFWPVCVSTILGCWKVTLILIPGKIIGLLQRQTS